MEIKTQHFYALMCTHCGNPIVAENEDGDVVPLFLNKKDAVTKSEEVFDEEGNRPKVAQVSLKFINKK